MQDTQVWSLGWEEPLEKGMVTHSSRLAWKIPWTEEPGALQSIGSLRDGHSWSDWAQHSTFLCRLDHDFWTFEGIPSVWILQIKQLRTFFYMVLRDIYLHFSWVNTKECIINTGHKAFVVLFSLKIHNLISKDIVLYSYTQWIRVQVISHFCQYFTLAFLMGVWWWFSHRVVSGSCDPVDCRLRGSSAHGILQARITGMGCHFLLQGIFPTHITSRFFTHWATGKPVISKFWLSIFPWLVFFLRTLSHTNFN